MSYFGAPSAWLSSLSTAILVFGAQSVSAQTPCDTVSTQYQINRCATADARAAERRLAALIKELSDSVGPKRAAELERVQVAWRKYRDAHCAWDAEAVEGGSVQPAWQDSCIAELTESRINELKSSLCEGGGDDCPAAHRYDTPKKRP